MKAHLPSCMRPATPDDVDHFRDESRRSGTADYLAFPTTEADIADILAFARAESLPVTPQGARTGITAGAVPHGGIAMDFSRMKRIAPAPSDPATGAPRLLAGPGATLAEVRAACPSGWFFSPDPTEPSASIGGMFACNASGALSFLYGPVRASVAAARILLEDGTLLALVRGRDRLHGLSLYLPGRPAPIALPNLPPRPRVKNAAGYFLEPDMDALDLFIGSEGTLGILADATLQLRPAPAERWALLAFPAGDASTADAVQTLRDTFRASDAPARLAALEAFNPRAMDFLRARTDDPVARSAPPGRAALYAEFHADSPDAAESALLLASDLLAAAGTDPSTALAADTPDQLARFKTFRHALPESVNALLDERRRTHPSIFKLGSDMAVPDERLPDVLHLYRDGLDASGLEYVVFGHVGNNHLHINILPRDEADMETGAALYRGFASQIASWGGSLSAEHGIGKAKTSLLRQMYSSSAIAAMSRIRDLLSPLRLLNPDNLGI